ncbi:unnamed protein product [Prorocentrum cordatum]|uniref:Uncharacterized protein n=1 Tax=Prorocentrum cordatum TaxID=2364126 RepID=A0ABN9RMI1_9DINO|nr:unnamed protein product [Polarella glacialis]
MQFLRLFTRLLSLVFVLLTVAAGVLVPTMTIAGGFLLARAPSNMDPWRWSPTFPVGRTAVVNDGKASRQVHTAGASSLLTGQSRFVVDGVTRRRGARLSSRALARGL